MDIHHVAKLARLELTDKETVLFAQQMGDIIDYINKLNELDTSTIEPTAHVVPMVNVFRDDILKPSLPKDKALQNAPSKTEDFYKVPRILE
jgi:aspartyl-tRNA(Asn)/glutamyl-tRNA(Gln) amidotransferase subunit C